MSVDTETLVDPVPLTAPRPTRRFPVDAFPSYLAAMTASVAEATQTDVAMAGTSALSVLAAAAGGHVEVEVRPGWREPLCLFTATIANPGERKSAVQSAMTAPLLAAEDDMAARGEAARLEAITTKEIAVKAAEAARAAAGRADGDERDKRTAEAVSAATLAETIDVPPIPRLVADDVTPEAVAGLLVEQKGRLAIISAEGGIFDTIAGRYSGNVPNLDVFLKGHAGEHVKVDRRGRAPESIHRPALTIGLMVQPAVLQVIASNPSFKGRGFTARFLYCRPESMVGRRSSRAEPVPTAVRDEYTQRVKALAGELAQWAGDPAQLTLTPEAHDAVVDLMDEIEPQLHRTTGGLADLAEWGSKWVGATVRIASLLHLADRGADGVREPVTDETVRRAADLGRYYLEHAVAVFGEMGRDEDTAAAIYLRDRLLSVGDGEVSERDMLRLAQRFKSKRELAPALARLEERGWVIRCEQPETTGPGRPPSPRFRLHPHAERCA